LPHPTLLTGQSITAGFVYRGPVEELQGRYFFSDFLNVNVYSGAFNSSTPVASYDGNNLTGLQNHTAAFEAQIGGSADIRNVTSFGEDNAGNLYIVKFGNGFFPPLGQGEIFRIVPGEPYVRSDLDFDDDVDLDDWDTFLLYNMTDFTGLTPAEAIARGDLDGDVDNDFADFQLFRLDYNEAHGEGALERVIAQVPEPPTLALVALAIACGQCCPGKWFAVDPTGGEQGFM